MKGKRHTTEGRIRILREANNGKTILEVCREHNTLIIPQVLIQPFPSSLFTPRYTFISG